ncbi:MAG: diguanylate cyclase, partial [Chloroflexi bacterium]|nr:diguanylate cyclase [Chloroflexota bacterium]
MLRPEFFVPFIFVLAAIFYALLGLFAWGKRPAAGVVSFAWIMLSMSIWSFTYGLEIFFPLLQTKLIVLDFEYIGILGVPVFLFFFALDYTGRSYLVTSRVRVLTWLIPGIILLLAWTNPLHYLMWDSIAIYRFGSLILLSVEFGPASWVHIGFSFFLVIVACFMLVMDFLQRPGSLRLQISFVILAILFSLFGSSTFVLGISPVKGLDFAPLFFLPAAIGLSWVTLRYRLSEILTLEHLTVLKSMKDSVIVLNDQKRILYINHVTEDLLRRTEDEAIGQPFHYVAKEFALALDPYLSNGEQHVEIQIGNGYGEKTFEVFISPIAAANHTLSDSIITLHDITQRKEKEQELSRHGAIMSAISLAAEQFLKAADWERNIAEVLNNFGTAADVSRIHVATNSTYENKIVFSSLKYEWAADGVPSQINNPNLQQVSLEKAGFSRWFNTLSNGKPIHGLVKDLPGQEAPLLSELGSLSIAAMPIFVDETWWGFILFDECREERLWTNMELDAFQAAANILGAAETHSRISAKLTRRQLAMSLLQDIVTLSLKATNMKEMADTVVGRLAKLIEADGCYLTLWDETNRRTIPFAAYGPQKERYTHIQVSPGDVTFTSSVLDRGYTLVVEDLDNTPYATSSITRLFPAKSILALPMIVMEKKLGAVLVAFDDFHKFDTEEIQICEQAASLIALTLEKLSAVDNAQRRADSSETLRKAGFAIAEQLEINEAVNRILEQLNQVVPYDSASVQLLEGDELVIVGGHGWSDQDEVIGVRFKIPGDNPNSDVIQTGKPIRLSEPWKFYKAFKQPPHDHIRSWLGVPLIVQEDVIGLLAIDSSEPGDFSEENLTTALEFANQVAVVLKNARVFQETQTQALTDPLTGIFNRRGLMELGEVEFKRATLTNRHFSAVMLDLDHFKKVNDTYGHAAGDIVLREFAKRCKGCIREIDYIGRYGGEEIIIFLPETNLKASLIVAERLRAAIANTPAAVSETEKIAISASLGVACRDENTTSL